jgi:hypothetical protein
VTTGFLILEESDHESVRSAPFIDGDDISRRYISVTPNKKI